MRWSADRFFVGGKLSTWHHNTGRQEEKPPRNLSINQVFVSVMNACIIFRRKSMVHSIKKKGEGPYVNLKKKVASTFGGLMVSMTQTATQ